MRAVWITRPAGPEALEVRETPDPEPGPGQVRIRVRAAGLNFAEVMAAQGLYPDAPKPPCVVGYEVAGLIDAVGDGTQGRAARQRVLVHMAAGGVGTAVLQLCRTVDDLEVFGTASAVKHDVLKAEGCAHPIDYHATDYAAEVGRLTAGEGVDVVLDPLGGHDWRKGLKLLRPCGRLVAYGFANLATGQRRRPARLVSQAAGIPLLTPLGLMNHNRTISGVNIGHLWGQIAILREELQAVLVLWDRGSVKPLIDRTYTFTEAATAHRRILHHQNTGKVVLKP